MDAIGRYPMTTVQIMSTRKCSVDKDKNCHKHVRRHHDKIFSTQLNFRLQLFFLLLEFVIYILAAFKYQHYFCYLIFHFNDILS
jgi:pyruvate kinase